MNVKRHTPTLENARIYPERKFPHIGLTHSLDRVPNTKVDSQKDQDHIYLSRYHDTVSVDECDENACHCLSPSEAFPLWTLEFVCGLHI